VVCRPRRQRQPRVSFAASVNVKSTHIVDSSQTSSTPRAPIRRRGQVRASNQDRTGSPYPRMRDLPVYRKEPLSGIVGSPTLPTMCPLRMICPACHGYFYHCVNPPPTDTSTLRPVDDTVDDQEKLEDVGFPC
jgi:hypothetical protein